MAVPGLQCSVGSSLGAVRGFSLWWPLSLQSRGSRVHSSVGAVPGPSRTSAAVGVRRLSCSTACGILDQGTNPCLLHWQEDFSTEPQGSP